jgi:hypothetical protein
MPVFAAHRRRSPPEWGCRPRSLGRRAIRYYLCDTNSDRIEWPYPGFLPDEEEAGERVTLELEIDSAVWSDFKQEAERQGVPPQRLAQHAVLYFVADRDAGRITQRILDALADED